MPILPASPMTAVVLPPEPFLPDDPAALNADPAPPAEPNDPRASVSDAELDEADAIIARLLVADWRRRKQQEREADP